MSHVSGDRAVTAVAVLLLLSSLVDPVLFFFFPSVLPFFVPLVFWGSAGLPERRVHEHGGDAGEADEVLGG